MSRFRFQTLDLQNGFQRTGFIMLCLPLKEHSGKKKKIKLLKFQCDNFNDQNSLSFSFSSDTWLLNISYTALLMRRSMCLPLVYCF